MATDQLTLDELALLAAFVADPTLDDEAWLARVLARRVSTEAKAVGKVSRALVAGSRRVTLMKAALDK
jgi:hypothetical protein